MKRKPWALLLILCICVLTGCSTSVGAGGQKGQSGQTAGDKIVFVVAGGKLGDQAVNDASWEGIQKYAGENGMECTAFELSELQDFDSIARAYCDMGYNLIFCNSSALSEFVPPVAEAYPDIKFAVLEGNVESEFPNILNVRTRIADAGFLSGAFAVLFNEELTGERETAFIGGVRNPDLDRSQFGFAAGARYVGGHSNVVYVGNFSDAAKAKELATQFLSGNIRILQAWAGGANTGVFEAAKNMGEGYYSMGGATGQFHMSESIIASQVKNNNVISYDICKAAYEGTWEHGTKIVGLEDNAVGIKYAPDGRSDRIPQEIKDQIELLRDKIIAGEIIVPATEDEYAQFEKTLP